MITTRSLHGDLNIMICLLSPLEQRRFPPQNIVHLSPFVVYLCLSVLEKSQKTETRYFVSSSFIIFRFTFLSERIWKIATIVTHKQRVMGSLVSRDCKQFHQLHKTSLPIHEAPLHCWMRNWFNGPCHRRMLAMLQRLRRRSRKWIKRKLIEEFFCGIE